MYYTIINIIIAIKKYLNDWQPTDIFHNGKQKYLQYTKPNIGFFGISYGSFYDNFTYTKLGSWFENAPMIVSILKLFYYIPAWTVWCITNLLWFIIVVCLPKSIKNGL